MKRSNSMVVASALFCLGCVVLYGCSSAPEDTSDEGLVPAARGGSPVDLLKELDYKDVGAITGTVTFDGNPPDRPILSGVEQHADHTYCMQGDVTDPTWIVNPGNKGVANGSRRRPALTSRSRTINSKPGKTRRRWISLFAPFSPTFRCSIRSTTTARNSPPRAR